MWNPEVLMFSYTKKAEKTEAVDSVKITQCREFGNDRNKWKHRTTLLFAEVTGTERTRKIGSLKIVFYLKICFLL